MAGCSQLESSREKDLKSGRAAPDAAIHQSAQVEEEIIVFSSSRGQTPSCSERSFDEHQTKGGNMK